MTTVLVTGGAGFVGSHLLERLATTELDIAVLDDLSRGRREWIPRSCSLFEADVRNEAEVRKIVRKVNPDAVVHLAAIHFIPTVDSAPELAREINVEGTATLLRALEDSPPDRFVFASTGAIYPNLNGPMSERVLPSPIDVYGQTKLAGEELVSDFGNRTGTRCVAARLFNVVGPRETNPHVLVDLIEQVAAGLSVVALGNVASRRDFVDVRDVAGALSLLLDGPQPGFSVYNVGSGRSISIAELVEACAEVTDRRLEIRTDPDRMRATDRDELVADVSALSKGYGWHAEWSLRDTLVDLLQAQVPA